MVIGLLSICAIRRFGASLASNYKEPVKCVFYTINDITLDQTLLI